MKGLMIFANMMEDNEAISTMALLRRAGIEVQSASITGDFEVTTAFGVEVNADRLLNSLNLDNYSFLIVPGGPYVKDIVDTDEKICQAIKHFADKNQLIAAICAAPSLLGKLGLLENKTYTCYPGFETYASNGIYREDLKAITDGNIITARSAGAIIEFVTQIITFLKTADDAEELLAKIIF